MHESEKNFDDILKLDGIDFIKALLKFEKHRFDEHFKKGSVFEEINEDFGIFPKEKVYPVYFTGDVSDATGKIIFIGINPAFNETTHKKEQAYLEKAGSFKGYCHLFEDFFKHEKFRSPYYQNIGGFLRRYSPNDAPKRGGVWDWYQKHLINLDFIPYHSVNTGGLRINNIERYRNRHLKALLKILKYLNPQQVIFINGISTILSCLDSTQVKKDAKEFNIKDIIHLQKFRNIWYGKLGDFKCIGLPFLTRVPGGKDVLVKNVEEVEKKLRYV